MTIRDVGNSTKERHEGTFFIICPCERMQISISLNSCSFINSFFFPFHSFAKKEELQKENMNICQIVNHEMSAREGMNRSAKRISFSRKRHIPYIMASATLFVKIDQCYYNPHFRILLRNVQT